MIIKKYLFISIFLTLLCTTLSGCRLANIRVIREQNPLLKSLPDNVIEAGPVLGFAGSTELSIALKTDDDCQVTLEINEQKFVSPDLKYHKFHVTGLSANKVYLYSFDIRETEDEKRHLTTRWFQTKTLPEGNAPLKFCVYGDLRTQPQIWAKTAAAMKKEKPDFGIMLGDLVRTGAVKREWLTNFFQPGYDLFSTVPQYIAKGDHDDGGERWMNLFQSPNGTENWSQVIGLAHIIGINLLEDWSGKSRNAQWLNSVLRNSNSPYIFLALHAPPYASTPYGNLGADGLPTNPLVNKCLTRIIPIIKRYNVKVLFAGHVHAYERLELPDGLVVLTSGGAGAPLHKKDQNAKENAPYSKVFFSKYHYLNVQVNAKDCLVTSVDLNGKVLDQCRIQPRQ